MVIPQMLAQTGRRYTATIGSFLYRNIRPAQQLHGLGVCLLGVWAHAAVYVVGNAHTAPLGLAPGNHIRKMRSQLIGQRRTVQTVHTCYLRHIADDKLAAVAGIYGLAVLFACEFALTFAFTGPLRCVVTFHTMPYLACSTICEWRKMLVYST
jgi:hypothetical protein